MARNTNTRTRTAAKPTPAAKPAPAKVAKPKPTPANCACGCGQPTVTSKATFVAGHDARLAGILGRALATEEGLTETQQKQYDAMSDRLRAKADRVVETIRNREQVKAAKAAARDLARAAYKQALADATA